jgi:hypothetical protein
LERFKIQDKVRGIWCGYYLSHRNCVSGILTEDTRLVLVNAVYFKGVWQNQFSAANTVTDKFHLSSRESKEVPMMHKTSDFGYLTSDELDADILEMPYRVCLILCMLTEVQSLVFSVAVCSHFYIEDGGSSFLQNVGFDL